MRVPQRLRQLLEQHIQLTYGCGKHDVLRNQLDQAASQTHQGYENENPGLHEHCSHSLLVGYRATAMITDHLVAAPANGRHELLSITSNKTVSKLEITKAISEQGDVNILQLRR
jgi:hypothetical protein